MVTAINSRVQGWMQGVVSLYLPTMTDEQAAQVRTALTLYSRDMSNPGPRSFSAEGGGWLHVPRGWWVQASARLPFLQTAQLSEARTQGHALPAGTRTQVTFGVAPFPPGQPDFIQQIVDGSLRTTIGGLALAPTRSGKTYCALEAACRLGRATLILVDREVLARQWREAIEKVVCDGQGRPVRVGEIQGDRFDLAPEYPFVVGMIQTVARRQVDERQRAAFGTILVDEAQMVPTHQAMEALQRFSAQYLVGLTATPDRPDGLTEAIPWLCGPVIAQLTRPFHADVWFLHQPWANTAIPVGDGSKLRKPKVTRPDGTLNVIAIEKSLMLDEARVNRIADETAKAVAQGRQVLILVGLRDHARILASACMDRRLKPALFMGGATESARMKANPVVATFGSCAKGTDFDPPPTLCIVAAPRSDVRQAMGRALQPQAPCRPILLDVVDGEPKLVSQAMRRAKHYKAYKLRMLNRVKP